MGSVSDLTAVFKTFVPVLGDCIANASGDSLSSPEE